jgi:hypothetical protein
MTLFSRIVPFRIFCLNKNPLSLTRFPFALYHHTTIVVTTLTVYTIFFTPSPKNLRSVDVNITYSGACSRSLETVTIYSEHISAHLDEYSRECDEYSQCADEIVQLSGEIIQVLEEAVQLPDEIIWVHDLLILFEIYMKIGFASFLLLTGFENLPNLSII